MEAKKKKKNKRRRSEDITAVLEKHRDGEKSTVNLTGLGQLFPLRT